LPFLRSSSKICKLHVATVEEAITRDEYPADKLVLVECLIEKTAQDAKSLDKLALLRLDTDWHASTKAGLEYLSLPETSSG